MGRSQSFLGTITGLTVLTLLAGATAGPVQALPSSAPSLTAAEKADGWRLLFNGRDLNGWRNFKAQGVRPEWTVEDGAITLTKGGGGDLVTVDEYGAFELELEWRIAAGGNSGIIYWARETPSADFVWRTGPEMQVLDDARHPDGVFPSHRAGALYDLVVPYQAAARPVGAWNKARIVARPDRVEHYLNGVLVATAPFGNDEWRAMVAKSKFGAMPEFGLVPRGHIALQDHGDRVWYRNIRVRPLS